MPTTPWVFPVIGSCALAPVCASVGVFVPAEGLGVLEEGALWPIEDRPPPELPVDGAAAGWS